MSHQKVNNVERIVYFNTSIFRPFDRLLEYAANHLSYCGSFESSARPGFEDECRKAGIALVAYLSSNDELFVKRFKKLSDEFIIHEVTICDCGGVEMMNELRPFIASTTSDFFHQNNFGTTLAYIDMPMLVCKTCRTSYISGKVLLRIEWDLEKAAHRRVEYSIRKWVFSEK